MKERPKKTRNLSRSLDTPRRPRESDETRDDEHDDDDDVEDDGGDDEERTKKLNHRQGGFHHGAADDENQAKGSGRCDLETRMNTTLGLWIRFFSRKPDW